MERNQRILVKKAFKKRICKRNNSMKTTISNCIDIYLHNWLYMFFFELDAYGNETFRRFMDFLS